MKMNKKTKIALMAILVIVLSHTNLTYAADEDAPPSLDFEQPPTLEIEIPDDNPDQPPEDENLDGNGDGDGDPDQPPDEDGGGGGAAKISRISANPQKFNPTVEETRISYSISKKAKVEVKILDAAGQTVVTLLNNQTLNAGNHNVKWLGTKNNTQEGQVVKTGIYTYKITAKNSSTLATEDSKQGQVEIIGGSTGRQTGSDSNQDKATVALNNSKSGTTVDTGPGIFIYPLIPALAYFIRRKLRK